MRKYILTGKRKKADRMLKAVLDTNVLVSGLIMTGKPRELLSRISRKELILVTSKEILDEFIKVMKRKKFAEYRRASL